MSATAQKNWISEKDAANLLGYDRSPRTLRRKILGTGAYAGKEKLPIKITTGGKSYRYWLPDVQKVLDKHAS